MNLQHLKSLHAKAKPVNVWNNDKYSLRFAEALVNAFHDIIKELEAGRELAKVVQNCGIDFGKQSKARAVVRLALARYQSQLNKEV